jgi:hypothetical protein
MRSRTAAHHIRTSGALEAGELSTRALFVSASSAGFSLSGGSDAGLKPPLYVLPKSALDRGATATETEGGRAQAEERQRRGFGYRRGRTQDPNV